LTEVLVAADARAHVMVSGRVQGVFFRQETAQRARTRGVSGWVRNLPDGRVEAVLEGSRDSVDSMVAWMHQGPRWAGVEDVEVSWEPPAGEAGFRVR
jgi:acylphosphatase